jgi:hypothetical protein
LHENWKKNKKVQILEFGICWPLSVELISENVGNILPEALVAINSNEKKCIKIG